MGRREIGALKRYWPVVLSVLVVYGLLYSAGIRCLFLDFLHVPCPGCGMTRAVLALLRLDFAAAFTYHPMVWSLPLLACYILFNGRLFPNRVLNYGVLVLIAVGFIWNYLYVLIYGFRF